jgi:hypothetical protein
MREYRVYKTVTTELWADIWADSKEDALKEAQETAIDWKFSESEEDYHTEPECRVCGEDNMEWNKCPNIQTECNDCCGCEGLADEDDDEEDEDA